MENPDFRESILSSQKKSLQYQSSLKSFLKLAQINNIDACLLKGAFMSNFMYPNFSMRSMRDIDLLVERENFLKTVNIMLANGYFFLNSSEKELSKFNFSYSHQAPILIDKFGTAFEIHHRLKRHAESENSDHLAKNLMQNKKEKELFGYKVSTPSNNFAFIHCCYHAIGKSKLNIGPTFLNDLMQFKNIISDEVLVEANKANCLREVKLGINLLKYLHDLDISDQKQVMEAVEIIIYCYKMPEFLPRKRFNLIGSLNESYSLNSFTFSFSAFLKHKFKQILMFYKSYSLNFRLHKKRSKFFKDFIN
tara:strand:- start:226 stop:1146 length:921 start_codon:yes stop_codon:yes gene_type:complete